MIHAHNTGLRQRFDMGFGNPERIDVGKERRRLSIADVEKIERFLLFSNDHVILYELTACERDFVQIERIAERRQVGIRPNVNAGEGNPQIKVEGSTQFDEFLIETLIVHRFADIGCDVENDRHGRSEFVSGRCLA